MKIVKTLNQLIIVILLLFCGGVFLSVFETKILHFVLVASIFVVLSNNKSFSIVLLRQAFYSIAILSVGLLLNWFMSGFNLLYTEYFTIFSYIVLANLAFICLALHGVVNLERFDFFMKFLLIYSIIGFFITNLLTPLFDTLESETYRCKHLYYLFYFVADYDINGVPIARNQGLFWEPGVLAAVLNLFFFRILFGTKINHFTFYLFAIGFCILTTFSTTGLVVFSLLFLYYNIKYETNKLRLLFKFIVAAILFAPFVLMNVDEKLNGTGENSYIARNYDFLVAVDVLRTNTLTGVGFSKIANKIAQEKSDLFFQSFFSEAHGNTNSIVTVFLFLGIPLGLLVIFVLYKQNLVDYEKNLFFIINIILLSSEPLIFSLFYIFILSTFFYRNIFNSPIK